jgi:suppressor of ftsI
MLRRLVAFGIACAWLGGCGGQQTSPSKLIPVGAPLHDATTAPSAPAHELPEPPVVRSVKGIAKVSLVVNSNSAGYPQFVFDNMDGVAPTIRLNPGDTLIMKVSDELPPAPGDKDDINIHFHGLGSSPHAPGDDVLGTLARPGQKLRYVIHVPKHQEPGLYWYHPHVHGETLYQVGSAGMSGALVINGLARHLPGLAKMRERIIIVRATAAGEEAQQQDQTDHSVIDSDPCGPDPGTKTTLNGAQQPVITIAPNEQQFFRLINATSHKVLKLYYGGEMELVAIDGFPLDTWPGTPPTKTLRTIVVPPAARAEFVITGPRSGSGTFRTLCYDSGAAGFHDPELKLATLRAPDKSRYRPALVGSLRVGEPLPQNAYTTTLPPIAARRTAIFSEGPNHFLINGRAFQMSDPPMFVVHVGTVEAWHIVNKTQGVHDFHIHQLHFLVKEINGVKLVHPYWADSVVIPHRRKDGSPGTLELIMDFRDPTIKGTFVFHCHILEHEDAGMMAKIQAI